MANTMRAVAYRKPGPVSDPASLEDVELPVPRPGPRDLLVRVEAVSVNPVDVKLRASSDPGGQPRVLGFDAAGVVAAIGGAVSMFATGDEVFYAGSASRPGSDAQFQVVDGGSLRTTLAAELGPIDADTLRRAHAMVEDGHMTGKVVVAGF